MQAKRNEFEAGFELLKIPFTNEPKRHDQTGSAEMFKRASVLTDSNVGYAANSFQTNLKR